MLIKIGDRLAAAGADCRAVLPRKRTLATEILLGQLIVLVLTVAVGFGFYTRSLRHRLDRQYEQRALAIAQATAAMPALQQALAAGDPGQVIPGLADQVRTRTGASYVVVIDRQGVRHSHPIPALIGQRIEEPVVALDGQGHVRIDRGSTGVSANGIAPLPGPGGGVVGEVSVGVPDRQVSSEVWSEILGLLAYAGIGLGVGAVIAWGLARRLKRSTFGLELDEIAALVQEREATLHGIKEGVVAVDPSGRITLINDQAHQLLHTTPAAVGKLIDDLFPEGGRLRQLLGGATEGSDQVVLVDDRCLIVNTMPVVHRTKNLGVVVTLRDRTEIEGALRELDDVRGLTDALRAQQHEFSNRMHTLAGLLELGHYDDAMSYLSEVSGATVGLAAWLQARVNSPVVVALIAAKTTVALERGVTLSVTEGSRLQVTGEPVPALVTILGNLIDNAVDAAQDGSPPAGVSVRFLQDEDHTVIEVTDTGPGIQAEDKQAIFVDGYSTKGAGRGGRRGLGLALTHQLVKKLGGSIGVKDTAATTFTVTLPRHSRVPAPPARPETQGQSVAQ